MPKKLGKSKAKTAKGDAEKIVKLMLKGDAFSRWLGIKVEELGIGRAVLKMKVRDEMLNGFGSAHGGIAYSMADSALAFAANTRGRKSVALENVISYPAPVASGDVLVATATELSLGNTVATYEVNIVNQKKRKIALFRGTVFRTRQEWLE